MNNTFQWTDELVIDCICQTVAPGSIQPRNLKEFVDRFKASKQPPRKDRTLKEFLAESVCVQKTGKRTWLFWYKDVQCHGHLQDHPESDIFDVWPVNNTDDIGRGTGGKSTFRFTKEPEQPKKEWEILAYTFTPLSEHLGKPIRISRDSYHWGNAERGSEQYAIHSVRRFSDNQVFTVGDQVDLIKGSFSEVVQEECKITSFNLVGLEKSELRVTGSMSDNGGFNWDLNGIRKAKSAEPVNDRVSHVTSQGLGDMSRPLKDFARPASEQPSDFVKAMSGDQWKDMPSLPWTTFNQRQQKTTREIALEMAIKFFGPCETTGKSAVIKVAEDFENWLNRPAATSK